MIREADLDFGVADGSPWPRHAHDFLGSEASENAMAPAAPFTLR